MGLWSTLAKIGGVVAAPFTGGASLALPAALEGIGAAAGAGSQAMASNRGTKLDAGFQAEQMRQGGESDYLSRILAGQQAKQAISGDAWRRLLQSDYISNYKPAGLNLSPYSRAVQAPSSAMMTQAADPTMLAELQSRANLSYDPYQGANVGAVRQAPGFQSNIAKIASPGIWERILGIAGPGLSLYGAARNPNRQPTSKVGQ